MQNLGGADAILREFYVGGVIEQINLETMALQMFEQESVEWSGKKAIVPLHTLANDGIGFRGEMDPLPTAGQQGYIRLEIAAKSLIGRFGFSGASLAFSEGEKASAEGVMTGEMKRLAEQVRVFLDKAVFTGGRVIGLVWQKQAAATVWQYSGRVSTAVDANYGVNVGVGHEVRFLNIRTGQYVGAGSTQVNAITKTTLTLNAAAPSTAVGAADLGGNLIVAGDVFAIVHQDSSLTTEVSGILGNLFDQDYFGNDRSLAANAITRSNVLAADFTAGAPVYQDLSLDAIQIMLDNILLASNSQPDGMLINPVHRQSYSTLLLGTAAGVPTAMRVDAKTGAGKGDGGFTSLGYADIPFRTAQHSPAGSIFFLNRKNWSTFEHKKGQFAAEDGKVLNKVTNYNAYEGFYVHYLNLVTKKPNASGVLTGVSFYGV